MDLQRTEQWHEDRRGKLSASRMHRLMNGTPKGINTLLRALKREIKEGPGGWLEGKDIQCGPMAWGIENESRAIALYEMMYDVDVVPAGFITHEDFDFIGASPDGFIGPNGIEVKCPIDPNIHALAWVYGMPKKNYWQVQTQILCGDFDYVDFISFDPRVKPDRRLYVQKQLKDIEAQKNILGKASWFYDFIERDTEVEPPKLGRPKFF